MAEIRNLTRNGETFYPLTHVEAVSDPSGNYIGNYVDNPEWIRVITDSEGKILAGIKANGEIEWSLGIPTPIKEYILSNISEIQSALSGKVDKIEGKSLSTNDYSDTDKEIVNISSLIDNPEFIQVITDSEDKILEGIKTDGTKVIELPLVIQGVRQDTINNPEFIQVTTDSEGKIIEGIDIHGNKLIGSEIRSITIDLLRTEIIKQNEKIETLFPTKDRNVLWLGTSIPAWETGEPWQSYAIRSCKRLGWSCYNMALGSSGLKVFTDNTFSSDRCGKDLCESTAEKVARYSATLDGPSSTEAEKQRYQQMMNWGYDKRVIPYIDGTIASCDLVVIDHLFNDRDAAEFLSDIENFENLDLSIDKADSSYDRRTIIGAFCFLVKKIWEVNPNIKIAICSYLENKTGSPEFPNDNLNRCGYLVCKLQEKLARHFNMPFLNMCDYNGFSLEFVPNTEDYISEYNAEYGTSYSVYDFTGKPNPNENVTRLQYYCPDGLHPHTDWTLRASDVLTQSVTKLLRDLI